jgi:hypothetical protein
MKIKNTTTKILLGIVLFLFSSISTHAGFGVSPTDIYNEYLRPGISFEREFTLSRSGSLEELDIYIETDLEDITSWFSFSPGNNFKFNEGERTTSFTVTVNVPNDAEYKEYNGVVRVKAVPSSQDIKGVSITQGVRLDAGLIVTEVTVRKLSILSIKAHDALLGQPVKIEIVGENQGNVDVAPRIKAKIMNLNMEVLEEHEISDFGFINANQTESLIAEILTELPPGEYFVEVQVFMDEEELRKELMVFNITEPSEEDEGSGRSPFIAGLMDFFRKNRTFLIIITFAIILALIIEILTYMLTGRLWEKEKFAQHREKPWAILLGSKRYARAALSFAIGFIILLAILLYPAVTIREVENEGGDEVASGETKGVEDSDFSLMVFPPIEVPRYLIYQEADTNSEVVYKAMEDQEFDVLEETEDWYKVSLEDGNSGWLEKRMVKSENQ